MAAAIGFRIHDSPLESDRHNFAVCDIEKGFSFCWIVPAAARNHDFFQSFFLRILYTRTWRAG